MLKNENIICISSIDWDFIWQQHQAIMSRLAKNGNKVLFIENTGVRPPKISDVPRIKKRFINWLKSARGFRKEAENLYIYSPLILPFPYWRVARWINGYLTGHLKTNKKDLVTMRSLVLLVSKRRRLLDYLKKNEIDRYRAIIKELGLRK